MPALHRLLSMLGMLGGAALAGLLAPMALAHAESTVPDDCSGAVCLVMGDKVTGDYEGFRPFITDWQGDQPYNVVVNGADGSATDAGSYDVKIEDYWSPVIANSVYQYGDFTPAAAASGADLAGFDDLSGVKVYDTTFSPGTADAFHNISVYYPNGDYYNVMSNADFTNTSAVIDGKSADYIQFAGQAPTQLWNSLDDAGFAQVPNVIPPDPWAALDFDPGQYEWGDVANM